MLWLKKMNSPKQKNYLKMRMENGKKAAKKDLNLLSALRCEKAVLEQLRFCLKNQLMPDLKFLKKASRMPNTKKQWQMKSKKRFELLGQLISILVRKKLKMTRFSSVLAGNMLNI